MLLQEELQIVVYNKINLPVVVSGGKFFSKEEIEPEAVIAWRLLHRFGVPYSDIIIEDKSRNTFENAKYTKEKLNVKTVILITSAYHMHRSVEVFKKLGINVIPAPTDYKVSNSGYNFRSFIPSAHALKTTTVAIKEYIGTIYYRIRF